VSNFTAELSCISVYLYVVTSIKAGVVS